MPGMLVHHCGVWMDGASHGVKIAIAPLSRTTYERKLRLAVRLSGYTMTATRRVHVYSAAKCACC